MFMRIKEIYDITKQEISNGQDFYEYIPIMYGLLKDEDYEALEGIRLAISDYGMQLEIPKNDEEMQECLKFIQAQRDKYLSKP
jgi:hypothetical protein